MGAKKTGSASAAAHHRAHHTHHAAPRPHASAHGGAFNHSNSLMVKNVHGTSSDRYTVPHLYPKYVAAGGTKSSVCQVKTCTDKATATAHVVRTDGRRDSAWYLARVCASHNSASHTAPMPLPKTTKLVPLTDVTGS